MTPQLAAHRCAIGRIANSGAERTVASRHSSCDIFAINP